jgi:hypothetical protein
MLKALSSISSKSDANVKISLLPLFLLMMPAVGNSDIIWSGDFETGDFTQWPNGGSIDAPNYGGIPRYGRPKPEGDGSLLELVTSPVRQGRYAAKFTVKNSRNGTDSFSDPSDCDGNSSKVCSRRRTELWMHKGIPLHYDGMPYLGESWVSISHYVPSDWSSAGGGFGPLLFQVKPYNEPGSAGLSPTISIELNNAGWKINHRWSQDPNMTRDELPWQWNMFYSASHEGAPYPREDAWPDGLADFPNVQDSYNALKSVNKGGWTDWIFHVRFDARGPNDGGTGFLRLWKREDSGAWIEVLDIRPKRTTRGGVTFSHGIGYNSPANGSNPGGFGPIVGMYMDRDQVWELPSNRVVYVDNVKVGSRSATFSDMSPDGSSPDSPVAEVPDNSVRPKPPQLSAD